ncbi:MAG: low specificity L-threonine aldolase [Bacteroidales bacterium]|nr:low specificity L-threonine aldolase [Bacteroidales bacterium]
MHPTLLEAIREANSGHVVAYGDDVYTKRAENTFREHFGQQAKVFFVLTGTGANVLSLASVTRSYHAIICAETAHIQVDECGAPEKFTGCKLVSLPTPDGKLTPEMISSHLHGFGVEHHVQPRVISISQPTEMGTVYTVSEIQALAGLAQHSGLLLHMDGARLANAAVSLDLPFKAFTTDAGVDVLSFGGTKNGMLFGESVVFLNSAPAPDFKYLRKQAMQLASKMRFISAQFEAYLSGEVWLRNAEHANRMARMLFEKVSGMKGITITQPVQANAVFAIIPGIIIRPLQEKYFFYIWNESTSEVRWMTSFDTTPADINGFCKFLASLMARNDPDLSEK